MFNEKLMQELHDRSTRGESLSPKEQIALHSWYDENDCAEDSLLNRDDSSSNSAASSEQLNQILRQAAGAASEAERLARQNQNLRGENERLRQMVENRLLEKAA